MLPSHIKREDALALIVDAFQCRDPAYVAKRKAARDKLVDIEARLDKLLDQGVPTVCAFQVFDEAKWLTNYTENWTGFDERCSRLEQLLVSPPPDPCGQSDDGSWGGCCLADYRKLEPTIDALQLKSTRALTPRPLAFMARLQDPEVLLSDLWALQISDIEATGRNRRDELGAVQSAMSQIIFKDEIRDLLQQPAWGFAVTDALEDAYRDYVRQTQHPRTGFWGPWYRFSGRLLMVQDLSFTFHQIHYLAGNIERWEQVIDTTLAIKDLIYPTGWRPTAEQPFNNHNNYDVAVIFFHGWSHMRRDQKAAATKNIAEMLAWCLGSSLRVDGFDDVVTVDAYYFGVRFLDVVGFWDPSKRFWRPGGDLLAAPLDPMTIALNLQRGFARVADASEAAETITDILATACRLHE